MVPGLNLGSPSGNRKTLPINPAVNGNFFQSEKGRTVKIDGWAPPFICCAQCVVGL